MNSRGQVKGAWEELGVERMQIEYSHRTSQSPKNDNALIITAWHDSPKGTVVVSNSSLTGLKTHSTGERTRLVLETQPTSLC